MDIKKYVKHALVSCTELCKLGMIDMYTLESEKQEEENLRGKLLSPINNQKDFKIGMGDEMVVLPTPTNIIKYAESGWPERLYIDEAVLWLIKNLNLKTIEETHEIMYYSNGVYKNKGDELCRAIMHKKFLGIMTEDGCPILDKKIMEEIINKIVYTTAVSIQEFDTDLDIINMKNGLFNWRTMNFFEHSPDYLTSIQIPVYYDRDAKCPIIDEVLHDIVEEKYYKLCLEFIAYLLYRRYDIQKAIILYGPGATGKSWFLDLCKNFVGLENCATETMQALTENTFAASHLYRKLLNECGDLDAETLRNTGIFKQLSSKNTVTVQEKFKIGFQMCNFAKMLFATNIIPKVNDKTSGFIRRIIIIPFTRVFREDEYNEDRINCIDNQQEISGLFNLVIPLLAPLIERQKFTNVPSNEDIAKMYNKASDTVATFLEERIFEDCTSYINKKKMYANYEKFCKDHWVVPMGSNKFATSLLKNAGYIRAGNRVSKEGKRVPVWLNCNFT